MTQTCAEGGRVITFRRSTGRQSRPTQQSPDLALLINEYLDHLDYRGRRAATNKRRRLTVRQFEQWIAPQAMTAPTADQLDALAARFPTPATRRAYTSDLRSFYARAERKRRIAVSPAVELDPVTVPKHQAHPVPPEGVARLLASASLSTRLMVGLAAYAGLRVSEIAVLRGDDISTSAVVVRTSKMSHGRTIPLLPELAELLDGVGQGPLFGISPRAVSDRIQRLMDRHGLGDYHPHNLRASFATQASRRVDPWTLMALLGHGSITTTQQYVLPSEADAARLAGLYAA